MRPWTTSHTLVALFLVLAGLAGWSASTLGFRYDFEAFFPEGDPDLAFYEDFRARFESDDNFLLVALPVQAAGFWDQDFLNRLDRVTQSARQLPYVLDVQSPTAFRYAIKSPFGFIDYPAIHLDQPLRWAKDSARLAEDERIAGRLFDPGFQVAVVAMRTTDRMDLPQSDSLMASLDSLLVAASVPEHHILGRANFQHVLVAQQKKEFIWSTVISGFLVTLVFYGLFRKPLGVFVALISVLLAMVLFLGLLGAIGRPLDFMAVLYPVLMIIVGVSDVVHIMTKYNTELGRGKSPVDAMRITRREIGLATLLTSVTTAIGFLTLVTSVVPPVKAFGWSAALGVLVAYVTVIGFTTSVLVLLPPERVADTNSQSRIWARFLERFYHFGKAKQRWMAPGLLVFALVAAWGMSRISTDVQIGSGMPRGAKITEDFFFFERQLAGFRPFEIAAIVDSGQRVDAPAVIRSMAALEDTLMGFGVFAPPQSITMLYKSLQRANAGDRANAYALPVSDKRLEQYRTQLERLPESSVRAFVSEDGRYARISTTVKDLGTDSINAILAQLDLYTQTQVDSNVVRFRPTGTGILFDKNNIYLRQSLIGGLSMAFVAISLLMAFLFRNVRMVLISLLPNVVPLLAGAAALGFLGIELDATTAIIFAISFGIAVDDTIHFLSKLRLELAKGSSTETAIYRAFTETGKAIALTSIVLFSGFCILLLSATPGTNYVGLLISITLFTALFADLLIIPWLVRTLLPTSAHKPEAIATALHLNEGGESTGTPIVDAPSREALEPES